MIDRVQSLGRPLVRVVDAAYVLAPRALEAGVESEAPPPFSPTVSEELLALGLAGSELADAAELPAAPGSQIVSQLYYDRLVLFGSFYIDVIV